MTRRYFTASGTVVHENVGVTVEIVPWGGERSVGGGGVSCPRSGIRAEANPSPEIMQATATAGSKNFFMEGGGGVCEKTPTLSLNTLLNGK